MVRYGVNASHVTESTGVIHYRRKDAIDEFKKLCENKTNFKVFELLRMEFHGKYNGATRIDVIDRVSLGS